MILAAYARRRYDATMWPRALFPNSRFLQMVVISPEVVGTNERAIERHETESY